MTKKRCPGCDNCDSSFPVLDHEIANNESGLLKEMSLARELNKTEFAMLMEDRDKWKLAYDEAIKACEKLQHEVRRAMEADSEMRKENKVANQRLNERDYDLKRCSRDLVLSLETTKRLTRKIDSVKDALNNLSIRHDIINVINKLISD